MRVSSTPQPFDSITVASEYWIARSSQAMTNPNAVIASEAKQFMPHDKRRWIASSLRSSQ
jgi:hypothetical protein